MNKKSKFSSKENIKPNPTSNNYSNKLSNKAHENSPFGEDEPSTYTTHK